MGPCSDTRRIVVGLTGATGQIFGVRALQLLAEADCEVHLILSEVAKINIRRETDHEISDITQLADHVHDNENSGATIASGSFETRGMLIVPCTMKTLSNVATGNASNLMARTADVTLKERRSLVLMVREKPFNGIHIENMKTVTNAGGIIFPPFLSFYRPEDDLSEMITRTVARAIRTFDIDVEYDEWEGISID